MNAIRGRDEVVSSVNIFSEAVSGIDIFDETFLGVNSFGEAASNGNIGSASAARFE